MNALFLTFLFFSFAAQAINFGNLKTPKKENTTPVLEPFKTDACTVSDKIFGGKYMGCCVRHDIAYWIGGEPAAKTRADKAVLNCLKEEGASEATLLGWKEALATGGKFYWGRRWHPRRSDKPLSYEEWQQVFEKIGPFRETIPVIKSYSTESRCPVSIHNFLKKSTNLSGDKLQCFDLLSSEKSNSAKSKIIYSTECDAGYFIYENFGANNSPALKGFGNCAAKVTNPAQSAQSFQINYATEPPPASIAK